MLRLEEDSAFLLARMQRNGYHVDLYVYDLYLRLDVRAAELAPFDKMECIYRTGTYAPSQILLRTTAVGPTLTAEKHGAAMQLHLQLPRPDPDVAARLTDWTAEGETGLRCGVPPDFAEAAVLDVVAAVRTLPPEPTTASSARA
jgi:hypothetical protein